MDAQKQQKPSEKPFNSRLDMIFWYAAPAVASTLAVSVIAGGAAFLWAMPAIVDAVTEARDDPFTGTDGSELELHLEAQMVDTHEKIALSISQISKNTEKLILIVDDFDERLRKVEIEQARQTHLANK